MNVIVASLRKKATDNVTINIEAIVYFMNNRLKHKSNLKWLPSYYWCNYVI